ncbi:hypothetical protein SAMN06298216_3539 [Spirosomataceae bacterium TFI 002]|nr:hypothetical protein SAMN06298216_3539 [Spirosomataceae bacterium TFI 002]
MKIILVILGFGLLSCSNSAFYVNDVSAIISAKGKALPFKKARTYLVKGKVKMSYFFLGHGMLVLEDINEPELHLNIYSTNTYGHGEILTLRVLTTQLSNKDSKGFLVYYEDIE